MNTLKTYRRRPWHEAANVNDFRLSAHILQLFSNTKQLPQTAALEQPYLHVISIAK